MSRPEVLVVTPWYPNEKNPYAGTFVRESVRALAPFVGQTTIIHVENVPEDDPREPFWTATEEGRVLWIGARMDPLTSRSGMMLKQREALAAHAADLLRTAETIHCHVGAPTGAALVPLIKASARLVVTEHATYLNRVFRDAPAKAMYRDMLQRADVVTAVSATTARFIENSHPGARNWVTVIANPVNIDALPIRASVEGLDRWLYVGNMTAHKGVRRLLRTFAAWVQQVHEEQLRRPTGSEPHLTLVGGGPLLEELHTLAQELGVSKRVTFHGPAAPDDMPQIYARHDVLVHLSHVETFGITSVEAAASGLAVVATASGGPEDTLVLHRALGAAGIVQVNPDENAVEDVLAALNTVRGTYTAQHLADSRAHFQRTYGYDAIARQLHAALTGTTLPAGDVVKGMRCVVVAVTDAEARQSETLMQAFAEFGGGGVYLTTRSVGSNIPASFEVRDASHIERCRALAGVERAVLHTVPGKVYPAAHTSVDRIAAQQGVVGKVGTFAKRLLNAAERNHTKLAGNGKRSPYEMLWRNVGPAFAAEQLVKDGTFAKLGLENFDCFVMADDFVIPFGWRALRYNPDLEAPRRWSRPTIAAWYARVVLGYEPGARRQVG